MNRRAKGVFYFFLAIAQAIALASYLSGYHDDAQYILLVTIILLLLMKDGK